MPTLSFKLQSNDLTTEAFNNAVKQAERLTEGMENLQSAFIKIGDDGSISIQRVSTSFNNADKGVKGFNQTLIDAQFALERIGNIANKVSAAAVNLTQGNIEAAVSFERIKMGLTAVLGSAEATEAQFKRLLVVAQAPGLGLPEAAKAVSALQSVRLESDLAFRAVTALGNAVARSGGDRGAFFRASKALTEIAGKTTVFKGEINQLTNAIQETNKVLMQEFGTFNLDEIRAQISSTQEFVERFVHGLEQLDSVANTTSNQIENFGDSLEQTKAAFGESILPAFSQLLRLGDSVLTFFRNLPETARATISWGTVVVGAVAGITAAATAFLAILPAISAGLVKLGISFTALLGPIGLVVGVLSALTIGIVAVTRAVEEKKSRVDKLIESAERLANAEGKITAEQRKQLELAKQLDSQAAMQVTRNQLKDLNEIRNRVRETNDQLEASQNRLNRLLGKEETDFFAILVHERTRKILANDIKTLTRQLEILKQAEILAVNQLRPTPRPVTGRPESVLPTAEFRPEVVAKFNAQMQQDRNRREARARQERQREQEKAEKERQREQEKAEKERQREQEKADKEFLKQIEDATKQAILEARNRATAEFERLRREAEARREAFELEQQQIRTIVEENAKANAEMAEANEKFVQDEIARRQRLAENALENANLRVSLIEDEYEKRREQARLTANIEAQRISQQLQDETLSTEERIQLRERLMLIARLLAQELIEIDKDVAENTKKQLERVKQAIENIETLSTPKRIQRRTDPTIQLAVRSAVGLPQEFAAEMAFRRELAKELQEDLLNLERDTAEKRREIQENERKTVSEKQREIEQLERESARKRIEIERELADARITIGKTALDTLKNFGLSVLDEINQKIQGQLATQLLAQFFTSEGNFQVGGDKGSGFNVGGFLLQAGTSLLLSTLTGGLTFDNPVNDMIARAQGRQIGRNLSIHDSRSAFDLARLSAEGFKEGMVPSNNGNLSGMSFGNPAIIKEQQSIKAELRQLSEAITKLADRPIVIEPIDAIDQIQFIRRNETTLKDQGIID